MNINITNKTFFPVNNSYENYLHKSLNTTHSKDTEIKKEVKNIPLNSLKANFLPSFGKYKKVANVLLLDRETQKPVVASLRKDQVGDFISYQILTGRKEAGYISINLSPDSTRKDIVITNEHNEPIPKVTHLRSLLGNKYAGIGTALMNTAIAESYKHGQKGSLFLNAETGYARTYSEYRSNESPIPFYYKMGFKAIDKDINKFIEECISKAEYDKLPPSALLLLTPDAISSKHLQFVNDFQLET